MTNEAHLRIDDGLRRGPRKRQVNRQPQAALSGQFLPKFTPQQKQDIIRECYEGLERGETTDEIGERHGVTGRAIRHWLLDDPQAHQARRKLINGELARTLDEMRLAKLADSPLPLACAREEFRAWSWIAERREREYSPKQDVTIIAEVKIDTILDGYCERLLAKLAPPLPIIEVEPNKTE